MGIRHVGVAVSDIARSLRFYEGLGFVKLFEIERSEPFIGRITGYPDAHVKVAMLDGWGLRMELIEYLNPRREFGSPPERYVPGQMHVCLDADPMDKLNCQLTELATLIGWDTIPDGPQMGAEVKYFAGPDGETIELFRAPRLWQEPK
jgi:catechol 2,3-dioxygenase-like lactoylglutathione lyase family enzyme